MYSKKIYILSGHIFYQYNYLHAEQSHSHCIRIRAPEIFVRNKRVEEISALTKPNEKINTRMPPTKNKVSSNKRCIKRKKDIIYNRNNKHDGETATDVWLTEN